VQRPPEPAGRISTPCSVASRPGSPKSTDYDFEVVAAGASGDLAYTVGYEHNRVKVDGQPQTYTLRATHVYRREDGQWRIVHRHADFPPGDDQPIAYRPTEAAEAASR
jgi:SnoaL-like domain